MSLAVLLLQVISHSGENKLYYWGERIRDIPCLSDGTLEDSQANVLDSADLANP